MGLLFVKYPGKNENVCTLYPYINETNIEVNREGYLFYY